MRWTHQRGTFSFPRDRFGISAHVLATRGKAAKSACSELSPTTTHPVSGPEHWCPQPPQPCPRQSPQGWIQSWPLQECKAVLSISLSSGARHIYSREYFHTERHSAPQHHTYFSCSHCKELNHQWPRTQHQLFYRTKETAVQKKVKSYPRVQQGCRANVFATDTHLLAVFRCAGPLWKGHWGCHTPFCSQKHQTCCISHAPGFLS